MKKLVTSVLLVLFMFTLAACGAPSNGEDADTEADVADVEVAEAETEVETIYVEVTVEVPVEVTAEAVEVAEAETETDEWGVLYAQVIEKTALYIDTGLLNEKGFPIFYPFAPAIAYNTDDIVIVYNGKGAEEFYLNDDSTLALAGPSFANAQGFYLDAESQIWYPEFPGRWRGDGNMHFYKVAGPLGAGLFIRADRVFFPICDNLFLTYPDSCNQ